jgi:hypothetical protein
MSNVTILAHVGFFVRRGFLSAEGCQRIRSEMVAAARVPAMVRPSGKAGGCPRYYDAPNRHCQRFPLLPEKSLTTSFAPPRRPGSTIS